MGEKAAEIDARRWQAVMTGPHCGMAHIWIPSLSFADRTHLYVLNIQLYTAVGQGCPLPYLKMPNNALLSTGQTRGWD